MLSVKWRRKNIFYLSVSPPLRGQNVRERLRTLHRRSDLFQKEEGHFFRVCSMLCIEAGESFPEMSGGWLSLILGRGKDGNRTSCGSRTLLPSTVLPGRNWKGWKISEKDSMRIRKRNNADGSDDKIRIASKWVEVMVTARPSSKPLCLPALRRVHWIWFIRQDSILSFLRALGKHWFNCCTIWLLCFHAMFRHKPLGIARKGGARIPWGRMIGHRRV